MTRTVKTIDSFSGEYAWLSNFYSAPVTFDNVVYPSVEHAYQAAKTLDATLRRRFLAPDVTAGKAKRWGRALPIRKDWEQVKLGVMKLLIARKFSKGSELATQLLATGDTPLVEYNTWRDTFWGVCNGVGENHLGKLLMQQRTYLRRC